MPSLLPIGGPIRLNPTAGGDATVVPLPDGGFAVVYLDIGTGDVFELYDDSFNLTTSATVVNETDALSPVAAALTDGQFVVGWLDDSGNIEASIYNADGSLATGAVTLATPINVNLGVSPPRIAGNPAGGFTAVWQDNSTGDLYVQSYDNSGNSLGTPITLQPPAEDNASINTFTMAVLGDGSPVVAAQVLVGSDYQIMYSFDGGALQLLAGGSSSVVYTNPQITALTGGGYVITYDHVDPSEVGTGSPEANWTTAGVVFSSTGVEQNDFAINTLVTTNASGSFGVDPAVVTPMADGGFVVSFEPLTSPLVGGAYLVDAQQFDANGNAVSPVVLVSGEGSLPGVATSTNGVVLDTYEVGSAIYLQPFNSTATPLAPRPDGGPFVLNSVVSANEPGVAPLTSGGFVDTWQDTSGNSWAQIYNSDESPVDSAFEVAAGGTQPVVAAQSNGSFMVAWSTGTQIMGEVYDSAGDALAGPVSLSGVVSASPLLDPTITALAGGGYMLAYETNLEDGGSYRLTIQEFDDDGNLVNSPVSQTLATNLLAPPQIAALQQQSYGSVTVIGTGTSIVAEIVSDTPDTTPSATQVTVAEDGNGAKLDNARVVSLNNGNFVVVWDQLATANVATWSVVGQIMTPTGAFVGGQFSILTALGSTLSAGPLALAPTADGGFLVTYDPGDSSLATQRYDQNGNALDGPELVSSTGQSNAATTVLSNGDLLLVSNDPADTGGSLTAQEFTIPDAPCFAAGTKIATTRGLVAVECIGPGDRVCTVLGGDTAEVIWTGHRAIDCTRHANPDKVWPVVILPHAFGRGMPATNLVLSPEHAVYVAGVLIPIRLLVNGVNVRQVPVDRISYHHVELAEHDVVLANGMPAETWLDTGNRSHFANGGEVIALHPDFAVRAWETAGCAQLVLTGAKLTAVKKQLAADAARRRRPARDVPGLGIVGRTGPGQKGPVRTGAGQKGPVRVGVGEPGPGRMGPRQTSPGRTGPGQTGQGQTSQGQTSQGQTSPGQTNPGQTGSGWTGPDRVEFGGPRPERSGQLGTGPRDTGYEWTDPEWSGPGWTGPGQAS